MIDNYFFVDGSALLSDIKKYKEKEVILIDKKFDLMIFSKLLFITERYVTFHEGSSKRTVFYFVNNDRRIKELINIPNFTESGKVEDMEIKYCGKKITTYEKAKKWLEDRNPPQYVTESLYKSEKAVDTQICCDALILLSLNKLARLFMYSNDYDFKPLFKTIKIMGANINLVKLDDVRVNKDLAMESDGLCAFTDDEIKGCFV